MHFIESTDPVALSTTLKEVDINHALFIIISKSGGTIETIAIYKYLKATYALDKQNTLIITENDSDLSAYAKEEDIPTFDIPKSVGGRFSVLSNVGLVPLAIAGVDIDALLSGAKESFESFFYKKELYTQLMQKAYHYVKASDTYNINCLFSYSELLAGFNKWYVQLWGESLGKLNPQGIPVGLTPIGLIGPVDQHSFLQLIMEGKRDKTLTFIKIKNFNASQKIPPLSLPHLETLDHINDLNFEELINMQADAIISAVEKAGDIPYDLIEIEHIDAYNIGKLLYYYQLLTSVTASFMNIDAYNQPGVEYGKIILKENLKKKK